MKSGIRFQIAISTALLLFSLSSFSAAFFPGQENSAASARSRHRSAQRASSSRGSSRAHSGKKTKATHTSHTHHSSGRHSHAVRHVSSSKPKYAYPLDFFMMHPPALDTSPLPDSISADIRNAFRLGIADDVTPERLVRSGTFKYHPLSGGIFRRREPIKYIVLHSTETGVKVPAKNVINAWNSMGRRHPGAQFVVDRDGTIYQALDPALASVHVNIFKTLPGINNDNTIGIEMNHTGRETYPQAQRDATMRLVTYLQHRYDVTSENVITHRYAQQGDHTDPVNFDLDGFLATKENFKTRAIALKRSSRPSFIDEQTEDDAPLASVYVQIHGVLKVPDSGASLPGSSQNKVQLRPTASSQQFSAALSPGVTRTTVPIVAAPISAASTSAASTSAASAASASTAPLARTPVSIAPVSNSQVLSAPLPGVSSPSSVPTTGLNPDTDDSH